MDLPPLSQDQLSSILSSAATPSELYEKLSQYEGEALLASDNQGNPELLSLFYAFFFFSHLPWCIWCERASFLPVSAAVRQQSTTMPLRLNSSSSLASSRTCSSFSTSCSRSRLTQRRKSSCVTRLWTKGSAAAAAAAAAAIKK